METISYFSSAAMATRPDRAVYINRRTI